MSPAVRGNGAASGDELSFDFVDPGPPVCGLVRVEAGNGATGAEALLLTPDETTLTEPSETEIRIDDDGTRASIAIEADGDGFEAEFTRLVGATLEPGSAFSDAAGITQESFVARAESRWRAGGAAGESSGLGRVVHTSGEPDWERIELVRSLTAALDDGSLLVVAAAKPAGSTGHDAEAVSAVLADADGSVSRFEEPLLSTEYDSGGAQRRVGVELWPADPDAVAVRGAGTVLASHETVAFLRFTLDGRAGTARYEILRGS